MDSEKIKSIAGNTVGYAETKDKKSFMDGVSVGHLKTKEYYEDKIKHLNNLLENLKVENENYFNDLKTLSSIINRYSE